MERTTSLTKEELALEILKLSVPPIKEDYNEELQTNVKKNATATAEAYTEILNILNSYEPKIED
ncbi:hypothetical protein HOO31_04825 [Aliarcobacter cryaerophilus]|uniref:hypothetical protein n=1 Tax=Aliarcobacter cryaerophilus TaxID=28198 RepID=UPI00164B81D0|nr:hypothetical protein [Aliarcobacter cryaerophilus]QNK85934.1 hypothetical protein HOO31_04825 [Aliarcobacter cryaerophilus]